MKYRYYKISHEWADRLGESDTAPRHPDGMHLVTPAIAPRLCSTIFEDEQLNLLPEEAFEHIGAIGLSASEARASARGELRHESPDIKDDAPSDDGQPESGRMPSDADAPDPSIIP